MDAEKTGKLICQLRNDKNLTQKELAEKLNVTDKAVSKWERGIKLSGGQKQRVSIARCFLKNPPVLILDEATSALDTATEIKIQHSFDELSKGRTTIVIAHRLSTIKNADTIAVVDEKGIVESGSHEELLAKKGEYYSLYTAQKNL